MKEALQFGHTSRTCDQERTQERQKTWLQVGSKAWREVSGLSSRQMVQRKAVPGEWGEVCAEGGGSAAARCRGDGWSVLESSLWLVSGAWDIGLSPGRGKC